MEQRSQKMSEQANSAAVERYKREMMAQAQRSTTPQQQPVPVYQQPAPVVQQQPAPAAQQQAPVVIQRPAPAMPSASLARRLDRAGEAVVDVIDRVEPIVKAAEPLVDVAIRSGLASAGAAAAAKGIELGMEALENRIETRRSQQSAAQAYIPPAPAVQYVAPQQPIVAQPHTINAQQAAQAVPVTLAPPASLPPQAPHRQQVPSAPQPQAAQQSTQAAPVTFPLSPTALPSASTQVPHVPVLSYAAPAPVPVPVSPAAVPYPYITEPIPVDLGNTAVTAPVPEQPAALPEEAQFDAAPASAYDCCVCAPVFCQPQVACCTLRPAPVECEPCQSCALPPKQPRRQPQRRPAQRQQRRRNPERRPERTASSYAQTPAPAQERTPWYAQPEVQAQPVTIEPAPAMQYAEPAQNVYQAQAAQYAEPARNAYPAPTMQYAAPPQATYPAPVTEEEGVTAYHSPETIPVSAGGAEDESIPDVAYAERGVVQPAQPEYFELPVQSYDSLDEFLEMNQSRGMLRIQVLTASDSGVPVPGAHVDILKNINGTTYLFQHAVTDANGNTGVLSLPAPEKDLSFQPPKGFIPYAVYTASVSHGDYAPGVFENVMVFPETESLQVVRLGMDKVPRVTNEGQYSR